MNNKKIGSLIAVVGFYYLLRNFGIIDISLGDFWPLTLLIPGFIFQYQYFKKNLPSGVLVPAGILLTLGILFSVCELSSYNILAYLWPVFPLSVAIGLYQFYWFGHQHEAIKWTAFGIGGISIIFLTINTFAMDIGFVMSLVVIGLGFIIYKSDLITEKVKVED